MGNNFDEVVMSANVEDLRTCVVGPVCEGEECGWNVPGWSVPRAMRHNKARAGLPAAHHTAL